MNTRPITDEALADLLDEAEAVQRFDLGAILTWLGRSPILGAFVATQTAGGFELVSECDPHHATDLDADLIGEAIMTLRNAIRSASTAVDGLTGLGHG